MPWKVSEDGKHAWLTSGDDNERSFVGVHNDAVGVWIDLRSTKATGFPEFAVYVPKDGGHPHFQLLDDDGNVVTLDLLEATRVIKALITAGRCSSTGQSG
jgi:hypothetical protein